MISRTRTVGTVLMRLGALILAFAIAIVSAAQADPFRVDVMLLEHRDLPMLSEKETNETLALSATMIRKAYGREVVFSITEKHEFFEFIKAQRQRIAPYQRPLRDTFDIFLDNPRAFRRDVAHSIQNYGALDEVAVWLPPDQRIGITTYDDAALRFIARYEAALKVLKELKTKSGKPVLTAQNWRDYSIMDCEEFFFWMDPPPAPTLFLSNTPIIDDGLVSAAPHTLARGVAHGVAWPVAQRAMVGYLPHLAGDLRITGYPWKLSDAGKRSAIAYTIAHEIGTHLMLKEVDDYAPDATLARPMTPNEESLSGVGAWTPRAGRGKPMDMQGHQFGGQLMRIKIAMAQRNRAMAMDAMKVIRTLKIEPELIDYASELLNRANWD